MADSKKYNGSTWQHSLRKYGTDTDTFTTIPATIIADGTNASVGLKGNMVQTGTPTPTTPIQPQETGERTGNLADLYGVNTNSLNLTFRTVDNMKIVVNGTKGTGSNVISIKTPNIIVPAGTYTVKIKMVAGYIENMPSSGYGVFFGINRNTYGQRTAPAVLSVGDVGTRTFTLSEDTVISSFDIAPGYATGEDGPIFNNATFECWFYAGSDDKPYEPYGIKIPISLGGENLFDKSTAVIGERVLQNSVTVDAGAAHSDYIDVTGISTLTVNKKYAATNFYFYADKTITSIGFVNDFTANVPTGAKYCRINVLKDDVDTIMLNRGTSALPYEPYVQPTLSNIYLGEVETTRRIGKLVLTGQENWIKNDIPAIRNVNAYYIIHSDYLANVKDGYCSHYNNITDLTESEGIYFGTNINILTKLADNITTVADFRTYLAQQYANGTPVTIWYVLAIPETAVVNEPIRKIGNYADTVSYEQAQVSIPTLHGNTVVDVLTELKPSEIEIEYTGWHDANVKAWDGDSWE